MNVSDLTPTMRFTLGTCAGRDGADLSGLYHGATLNALIRRGLARRERRHGYAPADGAVVLTDLGRAVREEVRARARRRIELLGWIRAETEGGERYVGPDPTDSTQFSLYAACRNAGVKF